MCSNDKKVFSKTYYLAAGECNPQGELPLTLLMTRIIEVATLHANSWGVGYARLIQENQVWVLSRVTIEMMAYPRVNENYRLTTWIEDYNRHFSQRNMRIDDAEGNPLGYVRTIWMVIDMNTRASVDISQLAYIRENVSDLQCPIEPMSRLHPIQDGRAFDYTFGYMDCDFNRHVNTVRYLSHLMNLFDMDRYDHNFISRMEISFVKETRYGETAQFIIDDSDPMDTLMSVTDADGNDHVRARFHWQPRQ
ncbi:MAG: acyl-[Muribaculaceae bacterium]|nr:acyl-[acyl-carrier-protein] thioesterase [Muribaculaceae bacterium]